MTFTLDNPVWWSLSTEHTEFANVYGAARSYDPAVAVFSAVEEFDESSWADLAVVSAGAERIACLRKDVPEQPGAGFVEEQRLAVIQMLAGGGSVSAEVPEGVRRLGAEDVRQMMALVAVTTPGPFRPRTVELGSYYGHFEDDELLAMAGERMHPAGYTELSAVCTLPQARGRGLATDLIRLVEAGIRDRGEQPILHVAAGNQAAIRVYERLGWRRRADFTVWLLKPPAR